MTEFLERERFKKDEEKVPSGHGDLQVVQR